MPNISIINKCNLKCKYCFAENMIQEPLDYMTLETYQNILDILSKEENRENRKVGIIGGEPTLHPQFLEILKLTKIYSQQTDANVTLFTNGIELNNFIGEIKKNKKLSILLNCNKLTGDQYNKMLLNIDSLIANKCNFTLSCNIYLDCDDYSYLWNIISTRNLKKIRCSVAAPGGIYTNQYEKFDYYKKLKPIFIKFIQDAKKYNCQIIYDCNQIPDCIFTKNELDLIEGYKQGICFPVFDITSDLKIHPCFGQYDDSKYKLTDFKNINEAKHYLLLTYNIPKVFENQITCGQCEKYDKKICQGGCLMFNKKS